MAYGIMAGLRQLDAECAALLAQKRIRDLDEDAGAVASDGIGADSTAVLQVLQNCECVLDQLVRSVAFEVGNEPHTAGIVLAARIEEAARARMSQRRIRVRRARGCFGLRRHDLAFNSPASHQGLPARARFDPPATHPTARRKMPHVARSRTPPLHGPAPPSDRRRPPYNLPDRMKGCAAASGGAAPCGRSPQIASTHPTRASASRFPASAARR